MKHEQVLAWRRWVDLRHRVPGASARLFCCSWAGGNSLAFERWPEQLPGIEVVPLLLPGRLTRAGESPIRDLPELVQLAVEALCGLHLVAHQDIPCFIFGHEFGALVAFEICRRVQAEFPMQGLFVSSMSCPQVCFFTGNLCRPFAVGTYDRIYQATFKMLRSAREFHGFIFGERKGER